MNLIKVTAIILLLANVKAMDAQSGPGNCAIKFTYDAAGNRVKRVEQCGGLIQKAGESDLANSPAIEESNDKPAAQESSDDLDIAVLFPNPTSATCIVSLNKEISNATLELYDNQGKQVHYERVSGKDIPLNLAGLSSGSYIVIIRTENRTVHKTVVKN